MHRLLAWTSKKSPRRALELALFVALGVATAWTAGACNVDLTAPAAEGSGGGATTSAFTTGVGPSSGTGSFSTSGAGGGSTCEIVDDICNPMAGEGCACVDCAKTALCNVDQCVTDGICDPLDDACICPDCDNTHYCGDPTKKNCTDDGACDSFYEGCGCADCAAKPHCAALLTTCEGGHLDGVCAPAEACSCPDCFGMAQCVPCQSDGSCAPGDPCSCPGCATSALCSDASKCLDDSVCDILDEGCACADCAMTPACQGPTGTGSSGSGSSGSGSGSSSSSGP
jgi:hypothetical protein